MMPGVSAPERWPPELRTVQAIHDRYQREVVEGLGLCPFARRSRELGRVHRPVFMVGAAGVPDPDPIEVAGALGELVAAEAEAEIILLTFPTPPDHAWMQPSAFEAFLHKLRDAWAALPPPREFYLVSFHPAAAAPTDRPLTADSLVALIRRSPDPVIQCVDAGVLDRVRRQAQVSARERMIRELEAKDPALAALFASSINADPELSADIAKTNFDAHGRGPGRDHLEQVIAELFRARDLAYGLSD